jgi:hypothetical protein
MVVPLYKLFGGFGTKIIDTTSHLNKDIRPTIYIVSHKFSFMDILVAFAVFSALTTHLRTIAGVSDIPECLKKLVTVLLNYWCPNMLLIPYNKRYGNTTKEMTKHLCLADDIIIWQHPYNKSRGLYYILEKCVYEYDIQPRLVYIDIADKITNETINNDSLLNIIRKTRNKTYYVTSYQIEYTIQPKLTDIYENFTVPFWRQIDEQINEQT